MWRGCSGGRAVLPVLEMLSMSWSARWYVLRVARGREIAALEGLDVIKKEHIAPGLERALARNEYRGYLFLKARMTVTLRRAIEMVPSVVGFVGRPGRLPEALLESEVAKLDLEFEEGG